MIEVGGKPAITRIIEQFPSDTHFVIALGYQGALLREYLHIAHPEVGFEFVDVYPYEGPGSGLGLSLLHCEHALQSPFIFSSCDTLVKETIPSAESNWIGYAPVNHPEAYRTVSLSGDIVTSIHEKGSNAPTDTAAYIGLAGIANVARFWESMHRGIEVAIEQGEAYGLKALLDAGITGHQFTWHDTGTPEALEEARKAYQSTTQAHILEKDNEAIWFLNERVVKFSASQSFISNRVKRAQLLSGFVPAITASSDHFYSYKLAQGEVFSTVATTPNFDRLLRHAKEFWATQQLSPRELLEFSEACKVFYLDKTHQRVSDFLMRYRLEDKPLTINGVSLPSISEQIDALDWKELTTGIPSRFHGDFHFENILFDEHSDDITFLDWRQDFAGNLEVGDVYYDLAKLLHGLIVNHKIVTDEHFWIHWSGCKIDFDIHRSHRLVVCEERFKAWLLDEGYDIDKVYTLCGLVFINIAPLHHDPYAQLLFALGKSMLGDRKPQ